MQQLWTKMKISVKKNLLKILFDPSYRRKSLLKPDRVIVILADKLIGTDTFIPVVMALKEELPRLKVEFLFVREEDVFSVKNNYVLYEAIQGLGSVNFLSSGERGLLAKLPAAWRLFALCASLLRHRTWLFHYRDPSDFPFVAMVAALRARRGSILVYRKGHHPASDARKFFLAFQRDLRRKHNEMKGVPGKKNEILGTPDRFVIYHENQKNEQHLKIVDDIEYTVVGSPRNYLVWRRFIDTYVRKNDLRDDEGAPIVLNRCITISVFYPGSLNLPAQKNDPRYTFLCFLDIVHELCPDIAIIIKPHVYCDLDELRSDLENSGFLNWHISHAHPQVLAAFSDAAFFVNPSNVMVDMYVEGVSVFEGVDYADELKDLPNFSAFPNIGRVDCSSSEKMRVALTKLINCPQEVPRPVASDYLENRPRLLWEELARPNGYSG